MPVAGLSLAIVFTVLRMYVGIAEFLPDSSTRDALAQGATPKVSSSKVSPPLVTSGVRG